MYTNARILYYIYCVYQESDWEEGGRDGGKLNFQKQGCT